MDPLPRPITPTLKNHRAIEVLQAEVAELKGGLGALATAVESLAASLMQTLEGCTEINETCRLINETTRIHTRQLADINTRLEATS